MKEHFSKIKIVPISSVLVHEGIVEEWLTRLSNNIDHDGMVKNPIICTRTGPASPPRYIALDGMHRLSALKQLGCRDILIYEVDYADEAIELRGWDGLILDGFAIEELLAGFAKREGLELLQHDDIAAAAARVTAQSSCLAVVDRRRMVRELRLRAAHHDIDTLIRVLQDFELEVDSRGHRTAYVADEQSLDTFEHHENAFCLVMRPFFSKEQVIHRILQGKLFPRKSTRHVFPLRPLRVDIDFTLLKEDIDLLTKNKLLRARLDWCLENNMVRYYPESVLVFSD